MASPGTLAHIGIDEKGLRSLRSLDGRFRTINEEAKRQARLAVADLSRDLKRAVEEEFAPHNKTGESIKTLRLTGSGMQRRVTGRLGMGFVLGTQAHVITGNPWLYFYSERYGHLIRTHEVKHPGYAGDDYVQRAFEKINARRRLAAIGRHSFRRGMSGLGGGLRNL